MTGDPNSNTQNVNLRRGDAPDGSGPGATNPAGVRPPDPLAQTVVPLTASGHYTTATEATPPFGRRAGRAAAPRGLTVRAKLALIYGALFVGAGIVLITLIYLLVLWRLNHPRANLPSWCTLTAADRAAGIRLTGAQSALCNRLERSDTLRGILVSSLLGLAVTSVAAFGVGYWVAGRVLRPLSRVTAAARRIAHRPDAAARTRISLDGPSDELRELADTFDEMLDRLDLAFQSQRRFTGNVSHELRTPLAINRTLLEVALADPDVPKPTEQLAKALLTTNERSERMIEGLLALARADNALVNPSPVDLAAVARRAAAQCEAEAAERAVTVRTDLGPAASFGDAALLERVATNLIQNGLRYNMPGGWVDVVTYDQRTHGLLVVANSGPVVPEAAAESLFEPFRRLKRGAGGSPDPADRGAGLGLSIVRAIVSAHRGRIAVQPRSEGGLIVRVWIPAVDYDR
ncbi:HAMP domain-containing histidine kinase [Actinocrinis puniceicyclus]|uniref:histidine kinase n=1 Tax=Actinocrinis puniceicyclus TaxID=977794 RepID=A0A8J7WKL6_9ACTN|nr:HAMP domain-containing sensor histidine kinase [Actinocrinis puniceicyclus]MBS2964033.1 HAMP domain-containing histidine kinase [Actinocrinis puniceicyclus]